MSAFGWLNSALRSRQDVATIVRQVQIRQFYSWDEEKQAAKRTRIRYRDIKAQHKSDKPKAVSDNSNSVAPGDGELEGCFQTDYSDTGDSWLDEPLDEHTETDSTTVAIEFLVDLDAPEIDDCLSDELPAGLKVK
ncbi:hypothetical protein RhiJN_24860 [Ceratobasidium sp. AG-Ba]|nr:hypothetical protein RhiJN_24860 [Ceratobasidium sp. AG-Ba]